MLLFKSAKGTRFRSNMYARHGFGLELVSTHPPQNAYRIHDAKISRDDILFGAQNHTLNPQ